MAIEKKWLAIPATALTADGTPQGVVTVADASLYHVKQLVKLYSNTIPFGMSKEFVVNRVSKPGTIEVGAVGKGITDRADVSAFLVSDAAQIYADLQVRPTISHDDFDRAVYEEEPAVALRTIGVDPFGVPYSVNNPFPVNADVTVNSVQVFTKPYDAITATYPLSTQEIYQSRIGGILGVVQETVTVNYVDSSKNLILNLFRT